jgi:hypothetical protein
MNIREINKAFVYDTGEPYVKVVPDILGVYKMSRQILARYEPFETTAIFDGYLWYNGVMGAEETSDERWLPMLVAITRDGDDKLSVCSTSYVNKLWLVEVCGRSYENIKQDSEFNLRDRLTRQFGGLVL